MRLAERRLTEAHVALEEAEWRQAPARELARLAEAFEHEADAYRAALAACDGG